jgi:hypothetical protein
MNVRDHANEKSQTVNTTHAGSADMYLINEALSRARTPEPQVHSEAHRSARRIAMRARRRQALDLNSITR